MISISFGVDNVLAKWVLRVCFSPLEDNSFSDSFVCLEGEEQWDFMAASLSIENLQSMISQRIAKWALVRKKFSNISLMDILFN